MVLDNVISQVTRLHPHRIAIKDIRTTREWTYRSLTDHYQQLAIWLAAYGIKKGGRVAVVSQNTPEHVILLLACSRIGAVLTPINCLLSVEQMLEVIDDSLAEIVFFSGHFEVIAERQCDLSHVKRCLRLSDDSGIPFPDLLSRPSSIAVDESFVDLIGSVQPSDVLYQMYTSGTTGKSKGAMISHANVLAELTGLSYALCVRAGDRVLIATPYFHGAAVMMTILAISHGGTCLVSDSLSADELTAALIDEHAAFSFVVPGMIINMLKADAERRQSFPSLKALVYGAAPIPVTIQRDALAYFGQKLVQIYGQTETVMAMTLLAAQDHALSVGERHAGRLQSVGREIFGCEVRVFDDQDRDVNAGEIGEVVARGDNIMSGYHNMLEATSTALRDGWLRTGDLATIDGDGYIYLRGRKKDLIICDGENVYPIQVERVIDQIDGVLESAVIGIPHPIDGEKIKAFVVLRSGSLLGEDDIIKHCKGHLGEFQCPRHVEIVDKLPRNTGGKILKTDLRRKHWEGA